MMSTFTFLRLAGGAARGGLNGALLAQCMRANPVSAALVPRKNLMLTPVASKRHYGPEEEHEKIDEVHHWKNERIVAVALLPCIPAALAYPHPVLDTLLVSAMVLHTHWRLSGVVQDYIHGQILPKIGRVLVILLTIGSFGSLCYFNYADVGFANAIRLLYTQL
jgi:succinate dehydrogenase (ubiquinone) membrane anchor subunit